MDKRNEDNSPSELESEKIENKKKNEASANEVSFDEALTDEASANGAPLTEVASDSSKSEEKPKKRSKKLTVKIIFAIIFTFGANLLFFCMLWLLNRYDNVQFDQILYQIKSPAAGTGGGLVKDAMLNVILLGSLVALGEIFLYFFFAGKLKCWFGKIKKYAGYCASRVATFLKKHFMPIASMSLVVSILIFVFRLDVHLFVVNAFVNSDFIEDNYVSPDDVELKFPEQKRNLIYIYLESMENTFADPDSDGEGGKIESDLIPELSQLARDNVSFTQKNGKYGGYTYVGSRWTAAALFAQTAGVIIKVPMNFDNYGTDGTFMPGITTLGDVLADEGYNQTVLFGSDAKFAARNIYFTEHGNYNIIDIYSLIDDGKLPEGYWEWWGFEDAKLFEFAKEELTRLASLGEPFNFTTLTADTHFPDGYECELCPDIYDEQYSNVLSCSSKQVYEFINWIKEQPFYENTTIILSGDHLTMDPEFLEDVDSDYIRTTYNCIINSPTTPVRENDREFATFDMFPTTLAALGVEIEGDRLGIGVNLFSDVKTLTEKYGYDYVESKLQKRSDFFLDTFYN